MIKWKYVNISVLISCIYNLLRDFFDFTLQFKNCFTFSSKIVFHPLFFTFSFSRKITNYFKLSVLFDTESNQIIAELIFDQWETTVLVTWLILRFVIGFNRNQNRENCWHQTSWAGTTARLSSWQNDLKISWKIIKITAI